MEIIPITGMLTTTIMVVLVVYLVTSARSRRVQSQVEMQSRLIDRFGTAPELINFLHSPAGRQFVAGVQGAPAALTRDRLMSGFSRSIVLISLGAAFLYLRYSWEDDFAVPAAILLFLGFGYLVATFVSYRLSQKLMGETPSEP